jgi:anti-sigma factor RsiW
MDCKHAIALIPGYIDAELSEAQAAPLRQHLMDCAECRSRVQAEKALSSWFVPEPALVVPPGFAARVTRRAFAGDLGREFTSRGEERREAGTQRFLLQITAIAAGLLIALSIGLSRGGRFGAPSGTGSELSADDLTRDEALQRLEALNRLEAEAAAGVEGVAGEE